MSTTVTPGIAQPVTVWNVAVIGSGYAGLTLGACLPLLDHRPECTDNLLERVPQLDEGRIPVAEASFAELATKMLAAGTIPVRAARRTSSGTGRAQFSPCADPSWPGWIDRPLLGHERRSGDQSSPSTPARL
jgi:hypothetical protein